MAKYVSLANRIIEIQLKGHSMSSKALSSLSLVSDERSI